MIENIQASILMILFIILIIIFFLKSFQSKNADLQIILKGKCPKCKEDISDKLDVKKGGCGGIDTINLECECGYSGSFNYSSSSCEF